MKTGLGPLMPCMYILSDRIIPTEIRTTIISFAFMIADILIIVTASINNYTT
jgi:hypothetical protein